MQSVTSNAVYNALGSWVLIHQETGFIIWGLTINNRRFIWFHFSSYSSSVIQDGTVVYTVTNTNYKPTRLVRGIIIADIYSGATFRGRAIMDVDYQLDGRVQLWTALNTFGLSTGYLHGDIFVPID